MLNLVATTDKIQLITGTAADLDVHASYVDLSGSTVTPGRTNTAITTAATTDIVAAPGASTVRNVKTLHVFNKDSTDSTDVTVVYNQNGTSFVLHKLNLQPGEALEYVEGIGWFEVSPSIVSPVYNQGIAAQGPGFAADTYVTGSDLLVGGRLKVGSRFQWRIHMSKTAASTAVPQGIIRFGTAGAIGDTARITFTGWPAQTAVVDEAVLLIEAIVRTAGTSGIVQGNSGIQHSAAVAAGFGEMFDAVTSSAFDLTVAGLKAGISLNGSTSAAWTITAIQAQAENLV